MAGAGERVNSTESLFEIQGLDVEAGQLRHRLANLEVREALQSARAEQAEKQTAIDEVEMKRVEVATRQRRHEDEAATVEAKGDADDARLYSGEVSGMKDLQALQDEIAGLRARQRGLEDQALEAMVEAEELAAELESLVASRADVDAQVTALEAEVKAAEHEIEDQLARIATQRTAAVHVVDDDLLARYEGLKEAFGSTTVVGFDDSTGCRCPSTMPAVEADRVKHCPPGSVLDCSECGRIVVR